MPPTGIYVPNINKPSFALSFKTICRYNNKEMDCREFINGLVKHIFRLRNSTSRFLFPIDEAYLQRKITNHRN